MRFTRFSLVFFVFVSVFVILPEIFSLNFLKPIVIPEIEKGLNRKVNIYGNIKIRVFPYLRLIAEGIEIQNTKGAAHEKFLTIDSLVIKTDITPLLMKKIVLNARITRPKLNLEVFEGDQNNWSFSDTLKKEQESLDKKTNTQDPTKVGGWLVKINSVHIGDAFVEYKDRKIVSQYELATVGIGATTLLGPYYINGRAYHNYKKYDFSLRTFGKLGKTKTRVLMRFREAGDVFSTLFRGYVITDPLAVKGELEGRASMLKFNLDGILLKRYAIHPMSHIVTRAEIESTEKMIDIKSLKIKLPITTLEGTGGLIFGPLLTLDLEASVPDKTSYIRLETKKRGQRATYSFDMKMAHMDRTLKLYKFDTPLSAESELIYKGDLHSENGMFTLKDTPITLDKARINTNLNFHKISKTQFSLLANTGIPDLAEWRSILNISLFPGLTSVNSKIQASGMNDNFKYSFLVNLDNSGSFESSGNIIQKEILKGRARLSFLDAKDLVKDLNGKEMQDLGPFTISCDLESQNNMTKIKNLIFDTKPIHGKGNMEIDSRGDIQDIFINMDWENLDIWTLLNFQLAETKKPIDKQNTTTKEVVGSSVQKKTPKWSLQNITWPMNTNINMDIRVKEVSFFQPIIKNAVLSLKMNPNLNMSLTGKSALTSKNCDFNIDVNPGKFRHDIHTHSHLNQIPIFPFMQLATTAVNFGGGLTAQMDIKTQGKNIDELMRDLNGYLNIQADGAFIEGYNLRKLSRHPASIAGMLMNTLFRKVAEGKGLGLFDVKEQKNESTPVNTLKADIRISSGDAVFKNLMIDAEGVNGNIRGHVNLGQQSMDLKGNLVFPEIHLQDVPSLFFTLVGRFDDFKFESNADKFVDYFISNVLANFIGKTLGSILLNAIVPGLGAVASVVSSAIPDGDDDAPTPQDQKIHKTTHLKKH